MEPRTTSRRTFLSLSLGLPLGGALASCGSAGPGTSSGGGAQATYWFLSTQPAEGVRRAAVDRFNKANPNGRIAPTTFQNDAYKTKVKTAIGAGQAPTIIFGWGGGALQQLCPGRPGRRSHLMVRAEPQGQGQAVPVGLRGRDGRRQDLRAADRAGAADRPVLQQEGVRAGRRRTAAELGRHHGPGAEVQRQGHRAVLPRRAVTLDQHDVAGVPLRPHRRPRDLPGRLRRREERLVRPRRHRRPDQGAATWSRPTGSSRASPRSPRTPTPTRRCCTPAGPR